MIEAVGRRALLGLLALTLALGSGAVRVGDPGGAHAPRVAGATYERAMPPAAIEASSAGFFALGRMRAPATTVPLVSTPALPMPILGDVVIAPPPEVFTAPPEPPAPPPAPLRKGRFDGVVPGDGVWAVSIGINDYPGSRSDLRSATADAEDVDRALASLGVPGDHRLLIRDRQANAETIRTALEWLVAHAGPDSTAVVFYAGHIRKLSRGTEAVVAADGVLISDREFADRLNGLQARRTWIALAACYSGGFTELLRPGRVLTAAASANSLAYENEAFGRSYLVEYMVRRALLQRRAPESVERAFAWAEAELRRDYPNRVPVQYDDADGEVRLGAATRVHDAGSSGGGSGGSGGESSGDPGTNQPPPSTTTTTEPEDSCSGLTRGIVSCGG